MGKVSGTNKGYLGTLGLAATPRPEDKGKETLNGRLLETGSWEARLPDMNLRH